MSSRARIDWDPGEGVPIFKWEAFCAERGVVYNPRTIGRNVYYVGAVELHFGEASYEPLPVLRNGRLDLGRARPPRYAERVKFSTFYCDEATAEVARLAWLFWIEYGGQLRADREIRTALRAGAHA